MSYISYLTMILFGGVFITSERFLNVENDAKAYFIGIAILLLMVPCSASKNGVSHQKESLRSHKLSIGITAVCLTLSLLGILQYAGIISSRNSAFPITGTFENPAGFAAAQSAMFPYACFLCFDKKRCGTMRCFAIVTSVACLLTVIISGSRSGVLAICVAAVVITTFSTGLMSFLKAHRWLWIHIILVVAVFSLLLYNIKTESADGRLFIWGRCIELISDYPLFGRGMDGFNKCYMDAQAAYFSSHHDSPLAMLADNITHPFNEYLLLTVKYGMAGLMAAISLLVYIVVRLFRADSRVKVTGLAVVASVFVMCQFSYPFHYAAVWYIATLAIIPAFTSYIPDKKTAMSMFIRIGSSVFLSLLLVVILRMAYLDLKWAEIVKQSLSGHTERMLPYYDEMKPTMRHNALYLYNYCAELNYVGRYHESLAIAVECRKALNDYDVQILYADNLENTGQSKNAIEAYHHASDMIPCRFEPLHSLMELYMSGGDTLNAVKVAEEILSKTVKIESMRVDQIKSEALKLVNR